MEDLQISFIRNAPIDAIESKWCQLQEDCKPVFFLTWDWIGAWLETVSPNFILVEATRNHEVVGLGILVERFEYRNGFVFSRQLHLNKTGNQDEDQIWIEYNDFLLEPTFASYTRLKIIEKIIHKLPFDELHIGVADTKVLDDFSGYKLGRKHTWTATSYEVNLQKSTTKEDALEDILSRNTRQQLRKNVSLYEQKGELKIEIAESLSVAEEWLQQIAKWHIQRWENSEVGSGFSNPSFVSFHKRLIANNIETKKIELLKVSAGDYVIGYLYNFINDDVVRFYLSAFRYEKQNKYKPGLLTHFLAIKHYKAVGKRVYDFMAGDARYKRSFATHSYPVYHTVLQKRKPLINLENILRGFKQSLHKDVNDFTGCPNVTITVTGGGCNDEGQSIAKMVQLELSEQAKVTFKNKYEYMTPPEHRHEETRVTFKSASCSHNTIFISTETEVLQLCARTLQLKSVLTHPEFNDVHHVIRRKNKNLAVVVTGGEQVLEFDEENNLVKRRVVRKSGKKPNYSDVSDLRKVATTKPHFSHPNFCFEIDNELWVTRCDLMDAVNIEDFHNRIDIGCGLVHDGVLQNQNLYFTTTNGFILVYDKEDLTVSQKIDLNQYYNNADLGWCRGVLPISKRFLLIGFTASRQSKRTRSKRKQVLPTRLVCFDVTESKIKWELDLSEFGMDSVFSILKTDFKGSSK